MSEPLRFLHASDLRLERPLGGLTEVPPQWRTLCGEAPRQATARAFELARTERCEFVALAGDVIDPEVAGLRLLRWLNDEFEKLDAAGIRVYWSGGRVDAVARWPRGWKFPGNVVRFKGAKPSIEYHDSPSAGRLAICGSGAALDEKLGPARWSGLPKQVSRVFVASGRVTRKRMTDTGTDYWALGGRAQPCRHTAGRALWRYCGTVQARSPREASPHGVSLVEWDGAEHFSVRGLACDAVRYRVEHVAVTPDLSSVALEERIRQRLELAVKECARPLLVWWRLQGAADLVARRGDIANRLLASLRLTHPPHTWNVAVDWESAEHLGLDRSASTVEGGFLQELRSYEPLTAEELRSQLPWADASAAGSAWSAWREKSSRRRWLNEAARLGLELLEREPVA